MPKMKTHTGAAKRFRLTGTGKIMRRRANRAHYNEHKSSRVTRRPTTTYRSRPRTPRRSRSCSASSRGPSEGDTTMARVKRALNAKKKRRVVLERASGYRGQRSRLYRKAKEQLLHSMTYAYRDRKDRKGNFRRLWIQRINAAARANGLTYNRFVQGLRRPASRWTGRSSPTSRSATRPRSPRWSRWPGRRCPRPRRPERRRRAAATTAATISPARLARRPGRLTKRALRQREPGLPGGGPAGCFRGTGERGPRDGPVRHRATPDAARRPGGGRRRARASRSRWSAAR